MIMIVHIKREMFNLFLSIYIYFLHFSIFFVIFKIFVERAGNEKSCYPQMFFATKQVRWTICFIGGW